MAKRKEWRAPLGIRGNLLAYPETTGSWVDGKWVNDEIQTVSRDTTWDLTLTFDSFDKGIRSAYRFIGRDEKDRKWPMSIARYIEMAKQVVIDRCKVSGSFGIVKQGQNFSLVYLGPKGEK
jgi:hypothetical protein